MFTACLGNWNCSYNRFTRKKGRLRLHDWPGSRTWQTKSRVPASPTCPPACCPLWAQGCLWQWGDNEVAWAGCTEQVGPARRASEECGLGGAWIATAPDRASDTVTAQSVLMVGERPTTRWHSSPTCDFTFLLTPRWILTGEEFVQRQGKREVSEGL